MPRSRSERRTPRRSEHNPLPATAAFLTAMVLLLTVAMALYGMPVETIITVLAVATAVAADLVRRLTAVFQRRRN